jgi:hypothetical protein
MNIKEELEAVAIAVVPTLTLAVIMVSLTGCSSTKVEPNKPQYCYTSQTIKTQNGDKVGSETTVECSDNEFNKITAKRLGLASNCGEFTYWMQIGGRDVQRKGISCQKPDGRWEVVNTSQ